MLSVAIHVFTADFFGLDRTVVIFSACSFFLHAETAFAYVHMLFGFVNQNYTLLRPFLSCPVF